MWRRWSVVLPCFVFLLQWVRSQGWIGGWKNNPCETQARSNREEPICTPSTQVQLLFHQSVLELFENKSRNFWNPPNTRSSSYCFFHGRVEARLFMRNLVLLCSRSLSAISALSCPSESLRQIESFILIVMTHQSCNHFGDRSWQSSSIRWTGRVVGMVLCVTKHAWLVKMLSVSAPVSWMRVWLVTWAAPVSWMLVFDFAKQGSLPYTFWSSESNSVLDLCSALGMCNSSTNRLFPLDIIT